MFPQSTFFPSSLMRSSYLLSWAICKLAQAPFVGRVLNFALSLLTFRPSQNTYLWNGLLKCVPCSWINLPALTQCLIFALFFRILPHMCRGPPGPKVHRSFFETIFLKVCHYLSNEMLRKIYFNTKEYALGPNLSLETFLNCFGLCKINSFECDIFIFICINQVNSDRTAVHEPSAKYYQLSCLWRKRRKIGIWVEDYQILPVLEVWRR